MQSQIAPGKQVAEVENFPQEHLETHTFVGEGFIYRHVPVSVTMFSSLSAFTIYLLLKFNCTPAFTDNLL